MNKNKKNQALWAMQENFEEFYGKMKWILSSNRGKNFQFMMLGSIYETFIHRNLAIIQDYDPDWLKNIKFPLDTLDD